MIQRIQSIYLLIATVAIAFCFVFPLYEMGQGDIRVIADTFGSKMIAAGENVDTTSSHIYVAILCIVSIIISFGAIFLFNNRTVQTKVTRLGVLINTILVVVMFYATESAKALGAPLKLEGDYGLAMYMPLVAMIFGFIAARAIVKDEMLVRSADRLR